VPLVAGVDSSTQSTKVVVCDQESGAVLRSASAPHPDATEVDPELWWEALHTACDGGLLEGVEAIAVAGQQHGMVVLDEDGATLRPALLWNDLRSAPDARDLVDELGATFWAESTGSVPGPSFTVTKLRWLQRCEPETAARVASVALPHDWLSWRLRGSPRGGLVTDRGDASGTGYWSTTTEAWRPDLVRLALGHDAATPRVASPTELVGETTALGRAMAVAAGTGDNMAAALGLGLGPGDAVVSVGTSGVASCRSDRPRADDTGIVAGFADATGAYLPLVCTLNAARPLAAAAALLGVDARRFDELALSAPVGAGGLTLVPFLDGERTPALPLARGLLAGLSRANATPACLARATVEGVLCHLAAALRALETQANTIERVFLTGGGARSRAIQALAPSILGAAVVLADTNSEWVALGAARQAAWALAGGRVPPPWPRSEQELSADAPPARVVQNYRDTLERALPLLEAEVLASAGEPR
jgi:xylulokinase